MAGSSKKVILAALVGNGLIAITKFIAAAITGSSAMLSEGIHSLVDTGNQLLLLHGMKQSKKPADERFPFGHGKEVYFWSFVVAILVFALGAGISIYEGVRHILHPTPISSPMLNYIVLGLAMVFEGFAWFFAFRGFLLFLIFCFFSYLFLFISRLVPRFLFLFVRFFLITLRNEGGWFCFRQDNEIDSLCHATEHTVNVWL